jgi:hypothetical protein
MLETQSTRPPARAPAAAEVTALLAIVSGVAAVMRPLAQVRLLDPWASALAVGFAAAVIGVPVLVFALEHGRTRVGGLVLLGGIAGALPPVLLLCSGALGLYSRHGASYVRGVLEHGASIPAYGLLNWHGFARLEGRSVLIGITSAVIFWLALLRPHGRRWVGWLASFVVLLAAAAVAWRIG